MAEPPDEIPYKNEGNGYNPYFEKSEDPTELVAYVQIIVSQIELKGKTKTLVPESPAEVKTSTQADPVFSLITNLEQQVARMKAFMNTLYQIQQTISESEITIRERQGELDTVVNKLNEVKRQITDITGSSDNTGL